MTKVNSILMVIVALLTIDSVRSQKFTVSTDVVSSYVWRGSKLSGVSIQPALDFTVGRFSVGAWGSAGFDGYLESDLYASYVFDFGLSLGLTDYYFPSLNYRYFDYSKKTEAHAFEVNLGYDVGRFSLVGNYIFNEAGGAMSAGEDKYFEVGYAFEKFNVFVGAGDGWHTSDRRFDLVNIGVSAVKDIEITDSFTLPLTIGTILNPEKEQFFVVAGISL